MGQAIITRRAGTLTKNIQKAIVALDFSSVTYDEKEHAPKIQSVTFEGNDLVELRDYYAVITPQTNAGEYYIQVNGVGEYGGIKPVAWQIEKAQGSISVESEQVTVQGAAGTTLEVQLIVTGDGEISVSQNDYVDTEVRENTLKITSKQEGTTSITITLGEGTNYMGDEVELGVVVVFARIYGIKKNPTGTKFVRTDDAVLFEDPNPAVGTRTGSSPFDDLYPWKDMVEVVDGDDTFVKIPKFWFKGWTDEDGQLCIQIADAQVDGFMTCPACMDRGDGEGERDYVLVGKYHCDSSYKSRPNQKPVASITRPQARSGCAGRGEGYCQFDAATRMTIELLYLVEFADYDSQTCIGYGCGNNSSVENTGRTDTMQYHTGTNISSRTSYGDGVKYRGIEGLWSGVYDWMDGIYINSGKIYVILDPKKFSDTDNGTEVGSVPSTTGWIKAMAFSQTKGFEWVLLPSKMGGSETEGVSDYSYLTSGNVVVNAGGYYQYRYYGLFYRVSSSVGLSNGNIGARLLKLPKKSS